MGLIYLDNNNLLINGTYNNVYDPDLVMMNTDLTILEYTEAGTFNLDIIYDWTEGITLECWGSGGYTPSPGTNSAQGGRYGGDYQKTKYTGTTAFSLEINVGINGVGEWTSYVRKSGETGNGYYCMAKNGQYAPPSAVDMYDNTTQLIYNTGGNPLSALGHQLGNSPPCGNILGWFGGPGGGGAGPDANGSNATNYNGNASGGDYTSNNFGGSYGIQADCNPTDDGYFGTYQPGSSANFLLAGSPGGGAGGMGNDGGNAASTSSVVGGVGKVRITYKK